MKSRFIQFVVICLLVLCNACKEKSNSVVLENHKNGKPKLMEKFHPGTDKRAELIEFNEKGDKTVKTVFSEDGVSKTSETKFHENGTISTTGAFLNGNRFDVWKAFFPTGELQSVRSYNEEGLEEGQAKVYMLDNGKYYLYYEGYFKDGKERGVWKFYNAAGDIVKKKDYSKENLPE